MDSEGAMQLSNSGYFENQTRYYNELLQSQELSDVTLACDGYEVGAHKTIISGSSKFFKEIIRKSKHVNVVKRTRKSIYYHQKTCHKSINNETINTKKHEDDNEVGKTIRGCGHMTSSVVAYTWLLRS